MDTRKYFQKYGVNGVKQRVLSKKLDPNKLDWHLISGWIQTDDDFKRQLKQYLYWDVICNSWQMTDQFMFEMEDYIDPNMYIAYNENISEQFYWHFKNKIDWSNVDCSKLSNLLKAKLRSYFKLLFK